MPEIQQSSGLGRRKRRYRLYIDESGDHTFSQVEDPIHRHLTLMGIWFEHYEAYPVFEASMLTFKDSIFGSRHDNPVILHRSDIIERRGPFHALADPRTSRRFDEGLLALTENSDYLVCAVVLDKLTHMPKKYRLLYHPYTYCLAALLERFAGWLELKGYEGDLFAESRGKKEDKELQAAFDQLYTNGTRFFSGERFRAVLTSRRIKFRKKYENTAGLQLCDLLAAPVKREIVGRKRYPDGFGGRLVDAARGHFNCQVYRGTVQGYGKVLLK